MAQEALEPVPLLVIAGPTACGKTEAAIRVAERVGGEIISADSMQIYRQLGVGTAKPTAQERARAVFHLVDCVDVDEPFTAADFQRRARAAIADVAGRGRLPILCGGTGLYVRAVLAHYDFPEGGDEEAARLRERLEEELARDGLAALVRRLVALDPAAEGTVDLRNPRRVVRALEVCEATGEAFTARRRVDVSPGLAYNHRTFVLCRPRPALYEGIEARVEAMLRGGWVAEVRALADGGARPQWPALQAIGYRHLLQWLAAGGDEAGLAGVVEVIKRDTRRFARRQVTWLRREPGAVWREWSTASEFGAIVEELCQTAEGLGWGGVPGRHPGAAPNEILGGTP